MADLTLIHNVSSPDQMPAQQIRLSADRATLAKRRWRGTAEDGREFGFDLDQPLSQGSVFFADERRAYVLVQAPEEVLEIPVSTPAEAARVAWGLGNLHFGVQVLAHALRVTDDPAVLPFLFRENIAYRRVTCVFLPLSAGAPHVHAHAHA